MNKKLALRLLTLTVLIGTIASVAEAKIVLRPVVASAISFTSTPVVSTVNVVVNNPNGVDVAGTLTLYVVQANGVPETVPYGRVYLHPGFTSVRVFVRHAISAVNWARVTNVVVVP